MFKYLLSFFCFTVMLSLAAQDNAKMFAMKLEDIIDPDGAFLDTKPEDFLTKDRKPFFKWLSEDKKDAVRYPAYDNGKMDFLSVPLCEVVIRFEDGAVGKVEAKIYDRGDVRDTFSSAEMDDLIDRITEKMTTWLAVKPTELRKRKVGQADVQRKVWIKGQVAFLMKWSFNSKTKQSEYIHLDVFKFDQKSDPRRDLPDTAGQKADTVSKKDIKENVKKKDDGDVYVDNVPMVDQGSKGYCAIATAERVLRYYGLDVSSSMLAQLAGADADRGTNVMEMMDVLKKCSAKFGVKIYPAYCIYAPEKNFRDMVSKYNNIAKKKKMTPISESDNILNIYQNANPELLAQARIEADKTGFKKFQTYVKENVDKGIPVVWSIITGVVKEEIPQTVVAGHMRLIIGYNQNKEIVFSDSWGSAHAYKKMSFEDAWSITTGYYIFDLRKQ